jgi:hypothetical protein
LAAELGSITFLTGFTSPSSPVRFALLPILSVAVWFSIPTCLDYLHRKSLASLVAGQQATFLLQYIEVVLLSKWSFEAGGPSASAAAATTTVSSKCPSSSDAAYGHVAQLRHDGNAAKGWWGRLLFGWKACTSFRCCGTPLELKNVPRFSTSAAHTLSAAATAADAPHQVPSRAAYVRQTLLRACLCYLVLDVLDFVGRAAPANNKTMFAPAQIPLFARLGSVTAEQVAVRVFSTLTCMLGIFCVINAAWSVLAAVAVGVFRADVRHWRPLFGHVRDAYTLRRFRG